MWCHIYHLSTHSSHDFVLGTKIKQRDNLMVLTPRLEYSFDTTSEVVLHHISLFNLQTWKDCKKTAAAFEVTNCTVMGRVLQAGT